MPQGNHHLLPSGIWSIGPTTSSIPTLLLKSARTPLACLGVYLAWCAWRKMQIETTYNGFRGKTMVFGNFNLLNHEPLSTEEIDKLKAAQAERKRQRQRR